MRAVTFNGKLAYCGDYPEPTPADGECLIRVSLAGICGTDLHITNGYMNFRGVLGHEMVGTVVHGSSGWEGKRVVSDINCVCRKCDLCQAGLANHCRNRTVMGILGRDGCFADLIAVPEQNLHEVPDVVSDEEAVFTEPLAAAYQILAQCSIESRTNVTVVGPGRLGLLVAQVLAETGCKLTVLGRNPTKLMFCEKKGIQGLHTSDPIPKNERDVVVECSGSPEGLNLAMQLVRPRGTIVLKSTYADTTSGSLNLAPIVINEINLVGSRCGLFPEALNALARQAIDVRSMISKTFSIEQAIEAFEASADSRNIKILLKINPK
ncbi:MAG: alcohol dehydrogenase catalytic domain-containing protein [Planctomycetes bacterium]|nr:alcohol dehydrogenase catalytic domain-containing protein [Planctomycetota bacterium]